MRQATPIVRAQYLVIGSGLAGLYFALQAAERGKVTILTKAAPLDSNTRWAQGGISAVLGDDDSLQSHVEDTLRVGAGLCNEAMVERCVEMAPGLVRRLASDYGAAFDRQDDGDFKLGREGGHSHRRVVHHLDTTGAEIMRSLLAAARQHPNITIIPRQMVVDLLSWSKVDGTRGCFGAYSLDLDSDTISVHVAPVTVLASGGAGKVYRYTSNPDVATADGVAMAYRLGAKVANLEFMQFHPTCLFHPGAKSFLVSEAVRGEGGILRRVDGSELMEGKHPMKSLAPRDIVAREIDGELKRSGTEFVHLDVTHLSGDFIVERFPGIYNRCLELGLDMRTDPLPVVPAAHYMCGGVVVDRFGRTDMPGLMAIGEVAMSGMHGACRLASNSLLEALVLATGANEVCDAFGREPPEHVNHWNSSDTVHSDEAIMVSANWQEVRALMWNFASIVRSNKRLRRAERRIELIREEIRQYYTRFRITKDMLELRNIALTGHLIIECATRRRESRGLHHTLDYPDTDPSQAHDTILNRWEGP
ncbi:MAG: L-aspartate oxidase [Nannocystales bacterium]